ncbi:class I SAM-dependent methyltransferase [Protaetiibacter larvae]|uniref:Class I SAM-dependent methyltransferase n=1 Tax=Protaetiibacter larvae TaxID=2592654 RepID=A0A5C1YBI8_9MICO|nr:class I SAM-dependent methyltransferase [Protaetiibacter larvae]QEO10499.1 class I SAM-dependent methyltransferase [Protaetiibacter larvae]
MVDAPEPVSLREGEWLERNRARWDEVVPLHVASPMYDHTALRDGRGRLSTPAEEAELADYAPDGWSGLRVLHLQCHFGGDTLVLAQRGAEVVGLDFSWPAIEQARAEAAELGLTGRARFVHANLYDARHALPDPEGFDIVYTTWGTITWLPDVAEWARIIAWFLKPGGRLYFADSHPAAWSLDDPESGEGLPQLRYPYFSDGRPEVLDEQGDYADGDAVLENTVTWEWAHPTSEVLTALLDAGLRLDFFHEHDRTPWRMFQALVEVEPGLWGWPAQRWMPLGFSLGATRTAS